MIRKLMNPFITNYYSPLLIRNLFCFFIYIHIAFIEVILDKKGHFKLSYGFEILQNPLVYYLILFLVSCFSIYYAIKEKYHIISLYCIVAVYTVFLKLLSAALHGRKIESIFLLFIFFLAADYIYKNSRTFFRVAGLAIITASILSVLQFMASKHIIPYDWLPAIPLGSTLGNGEYDIRRASSVYYQPLASVAVFAYSALIYKRLNMLNSDKIFLCTYYFSLLGMFLSKSWAGAICYIMFEFFIKLWHLKAQKILLGLVVMLAVIIYYFDISDILGMISAGKKMSFEIKVGLFLSIIKKIISNPLLVFVGMDTSIKYTENTFLNIVLQFGLVQVMIFMTSLIIMVKGNWEYINDNILLGVLILKI